MAFIVFEMIVKNGPSDFLGPQNLFSLLMFSATGISAYTTEAAWIS